MANVTIEHATVSNRAWYLNELLYLDNIIGIANALPGIPLLKYDRGTKNYNTDYFHHNENTALIDVNDNQLHRVKEWVKLKDGGKTGYAEYDRDITDNAKKLKVILNRCGTLSIHDDEYNQRKVINSRYFEDRDGSISIKKRYLKLFN